MAEGENKGTGRVIELQKKDAILPFHVIRELYRKKNMGARFTTNIPSLDKYLGGGLALGELYTVSGMTKNGKTLLMQSITKSLEYQEANPLWFQFEVPPWQFLEQFPTLPTGFMPGELTPYSMPWIENRIKAAHEQYNTRVIFIDHLHYLFDMARSKNPSLEIGTLVRKLKTTAVNIGLVVFMACHTTKGGKDAKTDDLDFNSLRDSSFIAQESDSVWIVSRTGDNDAQLKIEFHRRTGVLKKIVRLTKAKGWLVERIEDG